MFVFCFPSQIFCATTNPNRSSRSFYTCSFHHTIQVRSRTLFDVMLKYDSDGSICLLVSVFFTLISLPMCLPKQVIDQHIQHSSQMGLTICFWLLAQLNFWSTLLTVNMLKEDHSLLPWRCDAYLPGAVCRCCHWECSGESYETTQCFQLWDGEHPVLPWCL